MGLRAFWRVIHILPTRSGPRSQGVRKATEATGSYRSYRRQPSTPSRHPGGPPEPPRSHQFALTFVHQSTYGVIHNLASGQGPRSYPLFEPYTMLHPTPSRATDNSARLEATTARPSPFAPFPCPPFVRSSDLPFFHPSHPHIHLPPPWRSPLSRASHSPRWCHPYARNIP